MRHRPEIIGGPGPDVDTVDAFNDSRDKIANNPVIAQRSAPSA
jgi:hypothetical protein